MIITKIIEKNVKFDALTLEQGICFANLVTCVNPIQWGEGSDLTHPLFYELEQKITWPIISKILHVSKYEELETNNR